MVYHHHHPNQRQTPCNLNMNSSYSYFRNQILAAVSHISYTYTLLLSVGIRSASLSRVEDQILHKTLTITNDRKTKPRGVKQTRNSSSRVQSVGLAERPAVYN